MSNERGARIRELNDAFRTTGMGGRRVHTRGVQALGATFVCNAWRRVVEFDDFTNDNDPHGEHDFGSFELDGQRLFWKVDYYNHDLDGGSEDPSNAQETVRVLTLMLAEEY